MVSDEAERVRRFFDRYSQSFDRIYDRERSVRGLIDRVFRSTMYARFDYVLGALDGVSDASLLDVGCGSGRYSIAIAERGATRVVGIDYARSMIDLADRAAVESDLSERCEFLCTDFLDFESDERFDYSIAIGFFDYVRDPVPYLRKMAAATNRRLIASFPTFSVLRSPQRRIRYALLHRCPVYFYNRRKVSRILEDLGMTNSRVVQLKEGPGADLLADISFS